MLDLNRFREPEPMDDAVYCDRCDERHEPPECDDGECTRADARSLCVPDRWPREGESDV